jgi:glutamate-ammonia-ligase adenylyltransferase
VTVVDAVLALPRDAKMVLAEAAKMRVMIEEEKPPRDRWDIKLIPGGQIDLEFIALVAVITGKVEGAESPTGTAETLARLAPDFCDVQTRRELCDAYALYLALTQMTRLCLIGNFDRDDVPPGLRDLLLAVTDLPDFSVLEAHLKDTSNMVRKHFDRLLRSAK